MDTPGVPQGLDPVFYALSRFRRRKFQDCVSICTNLLNENPRDLAVWSIKTRALSALNYIDDTEMEEEGIGDLLLDDNATAAAPRPGTSFTRPVSTGSGTGPDASVRPVSSSGRPMTGFARPGSSSRPGTSSVQDAFKGNRPGTSRPATTLGRQVRLGTASMQANNSGLFIDAERLDMKKYAQRPSIAKALCDFLLYHDHNPRKALELCAEATVQADFKDWWWKARLGKAYYQLGLLRDAEKQFRSSIKDEEQTSIARYSTL